MMKDWERLINKKGLCIGEKTNWENTFSVRTIIEWRRMWRRRTLCVNKTNLDGWEWGWCPTGNECEIEVVNKAQQQRAAFLTCVARSLTLQPRQLVEWLSRAISYLPNITVHMYSTRHMSLYQTVYFCELKSDDIWNFSVPSCQTHLPLRVFVSLPSGTRDSSTFPGFGWEEVPFLLWPT